MTVDNIAILFGVFSAIANIVIAVIAARGRWWEKADKMDAFMDQMKTETSTIVSEMSHLATDFRDMRVEYREHVKNNSIEMRELQSKVFSYDHRISDLERRMNARP